MNKIKLLTFNDLMKWLITVLIPLVHYANAFSEKSSRIWKNKASPIFSSLRDESFKVLLENGNRFMNEKSFYDIFQNFGLVTLKENGETNGSASSAVMEKASTVVDVNNNSIFSEYASKAQAQRFSAMASMTPIMLWWEDVLQYLADSSIRNFDFTFDKGESRGVPVKSIQTEQNQWPLPQRISKAMYEECGPWIITLILSLQLCFVLRSPMPLLYTVMCEFAFLAFLSAKMLLLFDAPNRPQPLLESRTWEDVVDNVWSSQETLEEKRNFVMGWFYDKSFEDLRHEDALVYLAWMRYGSLLEHLSSDELQSLRELDLARLESEVNEGKPLPSRRVDEQPLGSMKFSLEELRYRHKPLIFYLLTHGANSILISSLLRDIGFSYTPADDKSSLAYWHRPAKSTTSQTSSPLVFAHGVGGQAFYYSLINDIAAEADGDIILLDLPFVSLVINDEVPSVVSQVESVTHILDKTIGCDTKATFAGHSYGTTILSWMVQAQPDRVSNVVFMDPICFQLHLKDILFKFHFERSDASTAKGICSEIDFNKIANPLSVSGLTNLAGSEMHTNMAMFRHFPWATIELWPKDIANKGIDASIMLSEYDEIVPSLEVVQQINRFNAETREFGGDSEKTYDWSEFLRNGYTQEQGTVSADLLKGAVHGSIVFDEEFRARATSNVISMIRETKSKSTAYFPSQYSSFANLFGSNSTPLADIPTQAATAWSGATAFLWN